MMNRQIVIALFSAFLFSVLIPLPAPAAENPAATPKDHGDVIVLPNVVYGHKDGMGLTFDVLKPTKNANRAGVLVMMSGGWRSHWYPPYEMYRKSKSNNGRFATLVSHGFTVFFVWHGSSPKYKVPDAVADVRRAVRYIRHHAASFEIDPDRIGVCGASAGGHLALMLGTTGDVKPEKPKDAVDKTSGRVAAVVAYFPPVDLRMMAGPNKRFPALDFNPKLAADVSPFLHVTEDDAPTLLIHGKKDKLVPVSASMRIHEAFQENNVPTELMLIDNAAHGFRGKQAHRAAAALADWFEKYLLR